MLSIARSNVPDYLRHSQFFLSLSDDEGEAALFEIPEANFKLDTSVQDAQSLRHLLSTLRFWGVDTAPDSIYDAAFDEVLLDFETVAIDFKEELTYLTVLIEVRKCGVENRLELAARRGDVLLIYYLARQRYALTADCFDQAILGGHVACARYLYQIGCPWHRRGSVFVAVMTGHIEFLKFFHAHGADLTAPNLTQAACMYGHADILAYLFENGGQLCREAFWHARKHIECLQYLIDAGIPWPFRYAHMLARENNLSTLKYILARGCPLNDHVLCNVQTVECVQIIHSVGFVFTEHSSVCAAQTTVEIMHTLRELGCPWSVATTAAAARSGNLDILTYLHEEGCEWNQHCIAGAINHNHLNCLVYAHEHGCPAPTLVTYYAAARSRLECLRYLRHQGFPLYQVWPVHRNYENRECVQYVRNHRFRAQLSELQKCSIS